MAQLNANDTTLIDVINLPYSLNTITNDSLGTVWLTGALGLQYYDYEKERFITTDPSFKFKIISKNGRITRFHPRKGQPGFPWGKFDSWLSHVPNGNNRVSVAKDKFDRYWVSTGVQIYIFKIEKRFDKIMPGYSTRGIAQNEEDLFIHTYSGIFKNEQLLFDKPTFGLGEIKKFEDYLYFAWDNLIRYHPIEKSLDHINLPHTKDLFRRIALSLEQINDTIWVGTNFGLGFLKEDTLIMVSNYPNVQDILLYEGEGIILASNQTYERNNIKNVDYLSSGGIYLWQNNQIQKLSLPELGYYHVLEKDNNYYMASDSGLVVWDGKNVTSFFTAEDGLSDNRTCNLAFDDDGFLWVSTFSGLNRINLTSGIITQYLTNVEFNIHSFLQQDSLIYMGSIDGIYVFNPVDFLGDDTMPIPPWEIKHYLILTGILFILLFIFISFFFRQQKQQKLKKRETKMKEMEKKIFLLQIEQIVIKNDLPISTSTLAHILDISERTLYRKFKQFELTPGNYLKELKIKRAKFLLNNTSSKVSLIEVAEKVGYSESYLQKLLKEEVS